jgi:hypothetical protein
MTISQALGMLFRSFQLLITFGLMPSFSARRLMPPAATIAASSVSMLPIITFVFNVVNTYELTQWKYHEHHRPTPQTRP